MDAKTLEALNASIEKWERNAEALDPDEYLTSPAACALCVLFHSSFRRDNGPACSGCPVADATGVHSCHNTPYEDASDAREAWRDGEPKFDDMKALKKAAHKAARREVAFLKSLLPSSPTS